MTSPDADINLDLIMPWLHACKEHEASDLHLKVGAPPRLRVSGNLLPLDVPPLTFNETHDMIVNTMDRSTREQFLATNEADYAISAHGIGRFRVNAYKTRGATAAILRKVGDKPTELEDLKLPPVIGDLALRPRGLVLVTGPTGSGKTTTLAAMVNSINKNRRVHILTVEDPIEVMHADIQSSVSQRELHTDTKDWATALRAAMREDPDVILIGEMRDTITVGSALSAAETGHFVMSTLHTTNAAETITRIIDFFPPHEQKQVRVSLSQSLQGVICQRLVKRAVGGGRVCVMEIMVASERVATAIADPDKFAEIPDIVAEGGFYGMQTFDQHLLALVLDGTITITDAKLASSNPSDFVVALKKAGIDPLTAEQG